MQEHVRTFTHEQQKDFLDAISTSALSEDQKVMLAMNVYPKLLTLQDALKGQGVGVSISRIENDVLLPEIDSKYYPEVARTGGDVIVECRQAFTRFYVIVGIDAPYVSFEEGTWHTATDCPIEETHAELVDFARGIIRDETLFPAPENDDPYDMLAEDILRLPDFKQLLFANSHIVFNNWRPYLAYMHSSQLQNSIEVRIDHKKKLCDRFGRNLEMLAAYVQDGAIDEILAKEEHTAAIPQERNVSQVYEPYDHYARQVALVMKRLTEQHNVGMFSDFHIRDFQSQLETSLAALLRKRLQYWKSEFA